MGQVQSNGDQKQLKQLEERYSLGKTKLGEGSYGTVWKATDRQSGEVVAVKQMSKAKLNAGGVRPYHNMGREVVMMRACGHENIAQLLGCFEDNIHVYLAMEFCEGGDLGDRVIKTGLRVSEEQTSEWCRQMCSSVAALHEKRICHRDLKPHNFMLTRGSLLKLSDFGLAVFVPKGNSLSERCGTPAFMSPELHLLPRKSRGYSFPADAWALGLCIYMLVVRQHPFFDSQQLNEAKLLGAHLNFGEDESSLGSLMKTLSSFGAESPEPEGPCSKPEVRQLCSSLINADEHRRFSAAAALKNPWLALGAGIRAANAAAARPNMSAGANTAQRAPHRHQPPNQVRKSLEVITEGAASVPVPRTGQQLRASPRSSFGQQPLSPSAAPPSPALQRPAQAQTPMPPRPPTSPYSASQKPMMQTPTRASTGKPGLKSPSTPHKAPAPRDVQLPLDETLPNLLKSAPSKFLQAPASSHPSRGGGFVVAQNAAEAGWVDVYSPKVHGNTPRRASVRPMPSFYFYN